MPIKKPLRLDARVPLALAAAAALAQPAFAQTDDTTPFYAGGSLGVSHVSNVYREPNAPNSDTVTSAGLLAGIDTRLGRQHLTLDGSLQNNRYSTNRDLNYRSHSLRAALNWQTVGNLSGVLSAKSDESLADFNIGGVDPTVIARKKNIESNDEYRALVRLGVATRYTLEGSWTHRRRDFTAAEYDRFVYRQDTGSFGVYATPAGNVRLGLAARRTEGSNPRYPVIELTPIPRLVILPNDYTREDIDFTTNWRVGGSSTVNTRISRSKTKNSLDQLRDFSGTTGSVGWTWTPSSKLQFNAQYSRDTGQESVVRSTDLDRVYTSWQLGSTYAVTGKVSLSARATNNSARRNSDSGAAVSDALEDTRSYNVGLRWAYSRSFSVSCQYDRISRDHSQSIYAYSANSYGCTGQLLVY
ncbi:hypothetical protein [Roseateles sp. LYH14W]|uniref:TIGR03016 family PEP-CTERM system-associated outer membrane protein n=1 Tax=Pelomonas parva TaxID=3299032 RepID=A0ABW7EXS9_9BURK